MTTRGRSNYQGAYQTYDVDFSPIKEGQEAIGEGLRKAITTFGSMKGEINDLTESISGKLDANPELLNTIDDDEATQKTLKNIGDGNVNLAELRGLAGKIAGKTAEQDRMVRQQMLELGRDRLEREDELAKSNQNYALLQQGYAHDHATYMHEKMQTIKGLENKNEFFEKELNAKIAQFGWTEDQAKEYKDTTQQRLDLLDASVEKAEAGAKMSKVDLYVKQRGANVMKYQDAFRGGPLGTANFLNNVQDINKNLLIGKLTTQALANAAANAPESIRSILEEQNKFAESIKKSSVKWKGNIIPFSDYMDLHFANKEDENVYPLKGEGAAGTIQGSLWGQYNDLVLNSTKRLRNAKVTFDDKLDDETGDSPSDILDSMHDLDRGAGGVTRAFNDFFSVPDDQDMTPAQIAVVARNKITETKSRISELETELESLGKPDSATMRVRKPIYEISPFESTYEDKPLSHRHQQKRQEEIPKEIEALGARLKKLSALVPPPNPAATDSSAVGWGNPPTP